MKCSIADMRNKEVINLQDGTRLGFVGDVEIDTENAKLTTIIIYGRSRLFGLLGRTDDIMIPWENIDVIGDETILRIAPKKKTELMEPVFWRIINGRKV